MAAAHSALVTAAALLLLAASGTNAHSPLRAASGDAFELNNASNDQTLLDFYKMDSGVLGDKLDKTVGKPMQRRMMLNASIEAAHSGAKKNHTRALPAPAQHSTTHCTNRPHRTAPHRTAPCRAPPPPIRCRESNPRLLRLRDFAQRL